MSPRGGHWVCVLADMGIYCAGTSCGQVIPLLAVENRHVRDGPAYCPGLVYLAIHSSFFQGPHICDEPLFKPVHVNGGIKDYLRL